VQKITTLLKERARRVRKRQRKFWLRGNGIKGLLECQNGLPCHAQLPILHFLDLLVISRENPRD
jgi:hypothetical protein